MVDLLRSNINTTDNIMLTISTLIKRTHIKDDHSIYDTKINCKPATPKISNVNRYNQKPPDPSRTISNTQLILQDFI